MKSILKRGLVLLLSAAMAFSLAACASSPESPASQTDDGGAAPAEGGDSDAAPAAAGGANQIVIARNQDSNNLDPVMQDGNVNIWVFTLCLEPLLKSSDDGKSVESNLAESWEVSDDGLTYTFKIRDGLKFSDGSDVTMDDIVWSYERAMTSEDSPWWDLLENLDSVEAADDSTFVVHVKTARPYNEALFTLFNVVITSKAHFDSVGETEYAKGPIGTGAYKFAEWAVGEYILMEKNEHYRDAANVTTESIRWNVVADDNTRIMQLQSGEVDIITDVPWSRMDEIASDPGLQAITPESTEMRGMALNCTKEPMNDVRVRQAMHMSINKEAIAKTILYGYGTAATSIMNPSVLDWNPNLDMPQYDPEGAKALLEEAGYPDGFSLVFTITAGNTMYEQVATLMKEQMAEVGIELDIQMMEAGSLIGLRDALELDLFMGGWTNDVPDPFQQLNYYFDPIMSDCVHTGWDNPEATELVKQSHNEMDPDARRELIYKAQQLQVDDSPFIALYYVPYPVAAKSSISGFVQTPLGNYRFDNLVKAE